MRKIKLLCLLTAFLMLLCACHADPEPEAVRSPYDSLIILLEAGDYDGARAMIDALEEKTAEPENGTVQRNTEPFHGDSVISADVEVVELTRDTVRDYFEFTEEFQIGEQSSCSQYIRLKEAYRHRLLSVEHVLLEVSFQRCEAYGTIDLEEGEFQAEYYAPIGQDTVVLELDNTGTGWLNGWISFSDRGCFPEYAMDVEIVSGSGKLVFAAE